MKTGMPRYQIWVLSKFGPANQQYTFLVSNAVGTIGYCDPVYVETGLLTKESDVYSFGVVLFEVLCGRLSIINRNATHQSLIGLVRHYYVENQINEIVYCNIKDGIYPKALESFTAIAYQCLKRDLKERPLMTDVVKILENRLQYQMMQDVGLPQQTIGASPSSQSEYLKVWKGDLYAKRQGQPVLLTTIEGYRNASSSESLAANWPPTMHIVRLISQDYMDNVKYAGIADFLFFLATKNHPFLDQLQEKNLCAVIQLPSQTLLLSVSVEAYRLEGMLFPNDMVVFKPLVSDPQQQQPENLQPQQKRQLLEWGTTSFT